MDVNIQFDVLHVQAGCAIPSTCAPGQFDNTYTRTLGTVSLVGAKRHRLTFISSSTLQLRRDSQPLRLALEQRDSEKLTFPCVRGRNGGYPSNVKSIEGERLFSPCGQIHRNKTILFDCIVFSIRKFVATHSTCRAGQSMGICSTEVLRN